MGHSGAGEVHEKSDLSDFDIVMRRLDDCHDSGCVLASAFFRRVRVMLSRFLVTAYIVSGLILTAVIPLTAEWRHGCCGTMTICADSALLRAPEGWAPCSLSKANYCNYDDCNLSDANLE